MLLSVLISRISVEFAGNGGGNQCRAPSRHHGRRQARRRNRTNLNRVPVDAHGCGNYWGADLIARRLTGGENPPENAGRGENRGGDTVGGTRARRLVTGSEDSAGEKRGEISAEVGLHRSTVSLPLGPACQPQRVGEAQVRKVHAGICNL